MTSSLHRRAEAVRRRVLVRSWEYRQRDHARGVWFRLRRLLADASGAFAVARTEAERLVGEGYPAEAVGMALEPPKVIIVVPVPRAALIPSARPVPIRLGRELLESPYLVLTPFDR